MGDVFAERGEFADEGGRYVGGVGGGDEEEGVDAGQAAVDVGDGALVLEITNIAYSAHDVAGIVLFCQVGGQAAVGHYVYLVAAGIQMLYPLQTLFLRHEPLLLNVYSYGYHQSVEQRQCLFDDGLMPYCEWVEAAGKECCLYFVVCLHRSEISVGL